MEQVRSGWQRSRGKSEISDADYVYEPTSEQRYNELVNLFLTKMGMREYEGKSESYSDAEVRQGS